MSPCTSPSGRAVITGQNTTVALPLRPPAFQGGGTRSGYLACARSVAIVSAAGDAYAAEGAWRTGVRISLAYATINLRRFAGVGSPLLPGAFTGTQRQPERSFAATRRGFKVPGREGPTSWPPERTNPKKPFVMNLVNPETKEHTTLSGGSLGSCVDEERS